MEQKEIEDFYEKRSLKPFDSSGITQDNAMKYINHYRHGLAPGSLRSVWLNIGDIMTEINAIQSDSTKPPVTGIRVYLAKYEANPGDLGAVPDGQVTTILALTQNVNGKNVDYDANSYYDYGNPCPPKGDCPDIIKPANLDSSIILAKKP